MHVSLTPTLLSWARERAGFSIAALEHRFPRLAAWEDGSLRPTLRQVEDFAKAVHVPVGYLFLTEPPKETLPIPDFRTPGNARIDRPSPDLLETIYLCQQRQEWYRDFVRSTGESPLPFVGSAGISGDIVETAAGMRQTLGFDIEERRSMPTWTDALRKFIAQADNIGILVMCSGVVQNNNRRHLDPAEFRGFAMADSLAPIVFVNGADTKAGQMFTLAHELAHVWLGQSAVDDSQASSTPDNDIERWCNRIAAELLVPVAMFGNEYRPGSALAEEVPRLARRFKVSTLVILRRIHDIGGITYDEFEQAYTEEVERLQAILRGKGGNFYLTQAARVSKRFARALVASTLEGQTLHRDAFRMLGFSKLSTFHELGRSLGVILSTGSLGFLSYSAGQ